MSFVKKNIDFFLEIFFLFEGFDVVGVGDGVVDLVGWGELIVLDVVVGIEGGFGVGDVVVGFLFVV